MKKNARILIISVALIFSITACVPVQPGGQEAVNEAYIQTAVASTLAVERGREAGAALSFTETPTDGTPSTPSAEETEVPDPDLIQDPQPTLVNPWMLQSWCNDHPTGCVKYVLSNKTDSWLQIELKKSDTGVTGFFTVRTKTIGKITLIPGQYTVKYTWWCDVEANSLSEVKSLGSSTDVFMCP
jgi:hypothetical protein